MNDMSAVIIPKSDQISADDLIAGPITIRIEAVEIRPGTEQPVSIRFAGDEGRPWKPCKSMSRVLVAAWGPDAGVYAGRSVKLYRDPTVKWGGMEVGGIRIAEMSHIDKPMVLALTATKGSRKPYTVKPLPREQAEPEPPKRPTVTQWLDGLEAELSAADAEGVDAILARDDVQRAQDRLTNGARERLGAMIQLAIDRTQPPLDYTFPGDR